MPVVKLNNVAINTQVLGQQGPMIVMCHGLVSGSVATWYFKFAPMLAKQYRVVLYDMRGHGKSEKTLTGYDVETMSDDLAAVISYYQETLDLHNQPVRLVGHSYGALIVLDYAKKNGTAVESMVVVDAPLPAAEFVLPGMSSIRGEQGAKKLAIELVNSLGIKGLRKQQKFLDHIIYLYIQSSLIDDVALAIDIDDCVVKGLTTPTLLVYGARSECLSAGVRLSKLLPNNQFKTLDCGHYVTMEAPEQLGQAINQFFEVCT